MWRQAMGEILAGAEAGNVVFSATFAAAGSPGSGPDIQRLFYFLPPGDLALEVPVIEMRWEPMDGGFELTMLSPVLAKDVYLRLDSEGQGTAEEAGGLRTGEADLSDNFFDLLPGRPRTLQVFTALALESLERRLRVRTLAEIPREGIPAPDGGTPPPG
jgi:beta-mannosidase